ncbi:helix-turn-helix domain-containing protein [Singulisphaera acidiphila]|nr:helix-turn-helix domain-containing protein [Singulisphaera acidiphila]
MSDRARVMLLVLEGMARERSYCWPSNDRLVEITGKCLRSVQDALNDLESPQDPAETRWIKRVFSDPKRRERRGIIMLRRIDPTKPAADSAEAVAKATAAILECDNLHSLHAESHAHSVQKSASELIKNKNNNNLRLQETSNSVAHEITLPVVGWPETTSGEGDVREEATTSESRDACQADLAEQLAKLVDLNGKPARQAVIRIATKVAELLLDDHSVKKHCQLLWRVQNGELSQETYMQAFDGTYGKIAKNKIGVLGSYFIRTLEAIEANQAHEEVENDCQSGRGADHSALPRSATRDRDAATI